MKIIFVRHGESEANVHQIISNTGYIHGLTEKGKSQANVIAINLENEYSNIVKIISSPLKRADETSKIISNQLNLEYHIDDRLIEFHTGILEGKRDPESWNQLYKLWNSWLSGKDYSVAIPGGESLDDVVKRVDDFLKSIINEKTDELKSYDLQNTDVVEIDYSKNTGFSCKKYGPL